MVCEFDSRSGHHNTWNHFHMSFNGPIPLQGEVMFGLVANVVSDHVLRHGAKVRIIRAYGSAVNVEVVGLSKGGRRVTKTLQWKRLTNIRPAFIPEVQREETCLWWNVKEEAAAVAQELTELWAGVRVLHPDGRVLQEGISVGQAFARRHTNKERRMREIFPIASIENRLREMSKERNTTNYVVPAA